tara:strand:+ start:7747 stop:8121 length:375 start_codon:yes stop_codon:yes gene_type:complete
MPTTITNIINEDSSTYLTVNVDGVERQASIYKISAWRTGTPATSPLYNYSYEVLLHNEDNTDLMDWFTTRFVVEGDWIDHCVRGVVDLSPEQDRYPSFKSASSALAAAKRYIKEVFTALHGEQQ